MYEKIFLFFKYVQIRMITSNFTPMNEKKMINGKNATVWVAFGI